MKKALLTILIIAIILIIPAGLISNVLNWILDAIKWIIFIDNAETGLPMIAEMIIKGICEAIIVAFAATAGISSKSPWVSVLSIVVGFAVCVLIYAICKYIIWILSALALLLGVFIFISVLHSKKEMGKKENAVL